MNSSELPAQTALRQSQRSRGEQTRSRQSTESSPPNYKEWISHYIEWVIPDAPTLLQSVVDGFATAPEGIPREQELMQVVVGDTAYRLHVVISETHLEEEDATETLKDTLLGDPPAALSIYLSWIGSDQIDPDDSEHVSLFLGVKTKQATSAAKGSQVCWIMRDTKEWDFHNKADYFQCPLVKVNDIIEDLARYGNNDATLVVQIQTPDVMELEPSRTDCRLVPTNMLEGFRNALDSQHTGDVKFICLEYGNETDLAGQISEKAKAAGSTLRPPATGSDVQIYRKRMLYAHSDILRARSEYFKALLDFNESTRPQLASEQSSANRHVETIYCNDADFQTLYWMLHYIYCNQLELSSDEPLNAVVKRLDMTDDSKARRVMGQDRAEPVPDQWGWHCSSDELAGSEASSDIPEDERGDHADTHGPRKASSTGGLDLDNQTLAQSWTGASHSPSNRVSPAAAPLSSSASTAASRSRSLAGEVDTAVTPGGKATLKSMQRGPFGPKPGHKSFPLSGATSPFIHPTPSVRNAHDHTSSSEPEPSTATPVILAGDPHSHPTVPPRPASSFAIYVLAHQYNMTELQRMAQAALLEKLTPTTACGLLLASYKYKSLYAEVKAYVMDNWADIQQNTAFLNAIQEVSNGM